MIIVNADDFGIDMETNWAITEAFKRKLCSSTTIITNGDAFTEAVFLAKKHDLQSKIGIHINLVGFTPLTSTIKVFHKGWRAKSNSGIRIDKLTKKLVTSEITAQIERCLNNGILPTHIDSHCHVHTIPVISQIVCDVAKQYGINKIRISRNCGLIGVPFYKKVYKILYNKWLRFAGFKTTDYFGSIDDVILLQKKHPNILTKKNVEIMCHPRKNGNDIVDLNGLTLEEQIQKIGGYNMAVSYNSLLQR